MSGRVMALAFTSLVRGQTPGSSARTTLEVSTGLPPDTALDGGSSPPSRPFPRPDASGDFGTQPVSRRCASSWSPARAPAPSLKRRKEMDSDHCRPRPVVSLWIACAALALGTATAVMAQPFKASLFLTGTPGDY